MQFEEKKVDIDLNSFEFSEKFKRNMNRIFREQMGARNRIPHPEVDNIYERVRSGTIRFFLVITGKKGENEKELPQKAKSAAALSLSSNYH